MAVSAFAILGAAGLAIDLGRMFITRNEGQTFTDFVALGAVQELDGTTSGVQRAGAIPAASPMKWEFASTAFPAPTMRYSTDGTTWVSQSEAEAAPDNMTFVEVVSTVSTIKLYFLSAVTRTTTGTAAARSVAGQTIMSAFDPGDPFGTLPFSPLAHDETDPNFGYTPGAEITLRWPSHTDGDCPGNDNNDVNCDIKTTGSKERYCGADQAVQWRQAYIDARDASQRGYIQENSADAIREAILDDNIDYTVELNQAVTMTTGVKDTIREALLARVAQDASNYARNVDTYADYMALDASLRNDRRIGIVPISNASEIVIGFAYVFLPKTQDKPGNRSLCAEYIGPAYPTGQGSAGTGATGRTIARLIQ